MRAGFVEAGATQWTWILLLPGFFNEAKRMGLLEGLGSDPSSCGWEDKLSVENAREEKFKKLVQQLPYILIDSDLIGQRERDSTLCDLKASCRSVCLPESP